MPCPLSAACDPSHLHELSGARAAKCPCMLLTHLTWYKVTLHLVFQTFFFPVLLLLIQSPKATCSRNHQYQPAVG